MTLMFRGISALIGESKGHAVWLSEWTDSYLQKPVAMAQLF